MLAELFALGGAALARGQLAEVFHRRFVVDQRLNNARAAELLHSLLRFYNRDGADIAHRIDFDRHSDISFFQSGCSADFRFQL